MSNRISFTAILYELWLYGVNLGAKMVENISDNGCKKTTFVVLLFGIVDMNCGMRIHP